MKRSLVKFKIRLHCHFKNLHPFFTQFQNLQYLVCYEGLHNAINCFLDIPAEKYFNLLLLEVI